MIQTRLPAALKLVRSASPATSLLSPPRRPPSSSQSLSRIAMRSSSRDSGFSDQRPHQIRLNQVKERTLQAKDATMFTKREIAEVVTAAIIAIVAIPCSLGQFSSGQKKPTGPWMDKTLTPDQRAELVVKEMTLDEKIQLVHGTGMPGFGTPDPVAIRSNGGGGFVPGIVRLGLPDLN